VIITDSVRLEVEFYCDSSHVTYACSVVLVFL